MIEFSAELKGHVLRRAEDLRRERTTDLGDTGGRAVMAAETWMLGDMRSAADLHGFRVHADEPEAYGGTATAPPPLTYLLAAFGFCEQTMLARSAALRDIALDDVRIRLRGYFNRRGGHVEGVPPSGFELFKVRIAIDSPAGRDEIAALMDDVEAQCYVFNTLRRAARIEHEVLLNGEVALRRVAGPGIGEPGRGGEPGRDGEPGSAD